MRDNSGMGKSSDNLRDPTLRDQATEGRHRAPTPVPGDEAEIGGNARLRGEDPSPDDRKRGETSIADRSTNVNKEANDNQARQRQR